MGSGARAAGRRGFTLLEVVLCVSLSAVLVGLVLDAFLVLYRKTLWLSAQQVAVDQVDNLRWFIMRDLVYADDVKVEDQGLRLVIGGPYDAMFALVGTASGAAPGVSLALDTLRFTVTYVYYPPKNGAPSRIYRQGPMFTVNSKGIWYYEPNTMQGMELIRDMAPLVSVTNALGRITVMETNTGMFALSGRGRVTARLGLVQTNVQPLLFSLSPVQDQRTFDYRVTASVRN